MSQVSPKLSQSSSMDGNRRSRRVNLESTSSGNFNRDPNQTLFKTSSLVILKAKSNSNTKLNMDSSYLAGAKRVMDFMYDLWRNTRLCDVSLTSYENKTFWAHKIALGAHSPFLAEKFYEQPIGTICHINLERFSSRTLAAILRFIYTTELQAAHQDIDAILDCGLAMDLKMLITACKEYLLSLGYDHALSTLNLAIKHNLTDIKSTILALITQHFSQITQTSEFLESDLEFIRKIASCDVFGLSNEMEIFHAVVAWIDFNRGERLQHAPELIGHVRMQLITPEVLASHVESVSFIFYILQCHDQLYQAYKFHSLKLSESELVSQFPPEVPRHWTGSPTGEEGGDLVRRFKQHISVMLDKTSPQTEEKTFHLPLAGRVSDSKVAPPSRTEVKRVSSWDSQRHLVVVAVGGLDLQDLDGDTPGKAVFYLDPAVGRWQQLTTMKYSTHHHGVAALGNSVYVIGGALVNSKNPQDVGVATSMVQAYDSITHQWRRLVDMKRSRAYHAVAAHSGRSWIYAVGGEDEHKQKLDSLEVYDIYTNQWSLLARLPGGARIGLSAAVCGQQLYIVGGYNKDRNGNPIASDVDCFDIENQRWTKKKPLPQGRCHANLVTSQGSLFLFGGRTRREVPPPAVTSLSSMMSYDITSDTWRQMGDLQIARHDAGSAVIGSMIYIVGGLTTPSPYSLASVECYDVTTGSAEWTNHDLPYKAAGLACCTMELHQ